MGSDGCRPLRRATNAHELAEGVPLASSRAPPNEPSGSKFCIDTSPASTRSSPSASAPEASTTGGRGEGEGHAGLLVEE